MARRRTTYVRKARSYARSGLAGGKGKLMKVLAGAAGGIGAKLGASVSPTYGPVLGLGAVGYFMNNDTLLTLAGMQVANMIPLGSSGSSGSGGWF